MVKKEELVKLVSSDKKPKTTEVTRERADKILNWCKVAKCVGLWKEVKKKD